MAPMYKDSGLAAVTFWNGQMRVYYQDSQGYIVEANNSSGQWVAGGRIGAQARLGSPLAAVTWGAATNTSVQPQIRVFYQDQSNKLSEYTYGTPGNNPAWKPGSLQSLGINFSTESLTACMVADSVIRVYYIQSTNQPFGPIVELAGDGSSWNQTSASIATSFLLRQGTPLASVAFKDSSGAHVRIYYASEFAQMAEMSYDDGAGWRKSAIGQSVGGSAGGNEIAALTWGSGSGSSALQIRTYSYTYDRGPTPSQYQCAEFGFDGKTEKWTGPAKISTIKPQGAMAAATRNDATKGQQLRVFVQGTTKEIGELVWGQIQAWQYVGGVPTTT